MSAKCQKRTTVVSERTEDSQRRFAAEFPRHKLRASYMVIPRSLAARWSLARYSISSRHCLRWLRATRSRSTTRLKTVRSEDVRRGANMMILLSEWSLPRPLPGIWVLVSH